MKILIADPSKTMRSIVRRTLRQAGFGGNRVLEAATGPEALATILRARPDLVLSEQLLDELDGLQCLEQARESAVPTKFGFITSEATALFRRAARDAGAHFVMSKPFTTEMFEHLLGPLLLNGEAETPQQLAPATLHSTLVTLTGRTCRVEPIAYWDGDEAVVAAAFNDEDGVVAGALFAEAGFACGVAAATNMADPQFAHYGLRKNVVPQSLQDCVAELMRILGGLLNQQRRRYVTMSEVWMPPKVPKSVEALIGTQCRVTTYDIHIGGYSGGRLTLANDLTNA